MTFWTLRNSGEKKERKKLERREKERTNPSKKKPTSFEEKGRISCVSKGSHTQIISEGEVKSSLSVYNK